MCHPEGSDNIYLNNEKGQPKTKYTLDRKQAGRGAGGCGVHLSPWIHQDYIFRRRRS